MFGVGRLSLPVSLATTILLDFVRSSVNEAVLGKVLGNMLDLAGSFGRMVARVEVVAAGH